MGTLSGDGRRIAARDQHPLSHTRCSFFGTDTQRGVLSGIPESAICVQRFDDSLNSAIRITYRISLRSSSLREPRYPLLTVVHCFAYLLWRLVSCLHKTARAEHVSQTLGVDKGVKN